MNRITVKTKLREKRGTGEGADYKPWILAREFGSEGTSCVFNDWKHGRQIQCLSQGEAKAYHLLRWRDDVIDIREQFPLDLRTTVTIAKKLGLPHPHDQHTVMTTDFLVTYRNPDGAKYLKAYNVKLNESYMTEYALKNFAIEQAYWGLQGIHLEIIYADSLNQTYISNIKQCVQYYNIADVHTPIDRVKYLVAHKQLDVDMKQPINWSLIQQKNKPLLK